jgi:2-dehydro-3-deoxyglucarate aldolase/4-hydroxy-2-oxoheptanedioate aldolase
MRPNPVKKKLADGGTAFGTMAWEFYTPGLAAICAAAGAEFLLLDMEHSGSGIDTMKQQLACCRGLDLVPFVRVPTTAYAHVAGLLDAGAMGIMVPMVDTAQQAADIVRFAHYPPHGRRGAGFGAAHDDYAGGSVLDKMTAARERTFVICQIETEHGLANVEAIAATDGVDCLWVGHFDLTNFLGIPGAFDDPRYDAAIARIVKAAEDHGKTAAFLATDAAWARRAHAQGFRCIAYGLDTVLLQAGIRSGLELLRSL